MWPFKKKEETCTPPLQIRVTGYECLSPSVLGNAVWHKLECDCGHKWTTILMSAITEEKCPVCWAEAPVKVMLDRWRNKENG